MYVRRRLGQFNPLSWSLGWSECYKTPSSGW